MEYRTLEVNVISAKDLNDINLFTKMDVYAVVSISGDPQAKQKTPVDRDGGKDPTWNSLMKFTIDKTAAQKNNVTLVFQLRCERSLGDKDIGEVHVPVKELLEAVGKPLQYVSFQVKKPSGIPKGVLNISYKIGDKFTSATAPDIPNDYGTVTAYPTPTVGPSSAYPLNPVMQFAPLENELHPPHLPPNEYPQPPVNSSYPPPNGYPPPPENAPYPPPTRYPPPPENSVFPPPYGYPAPPGNALHQPPNGYPLLPEYPPPNGYPPPSENALYQPPNEYPPQSENAFYPPPQLVAGYGCPLQQMPLQPADGYGYPPQQQQPPHPWAGHGYPPYPPP